MRLKKKKIMTPPPGGGQIKIDKKVCYVCEKKIKETQLFYTIGKDKNGNELYRHQRCKPPRRNL